MSFTYRRAKFEGNTAGANALIAAVTEARFRLKRFHVINASGTSVNLYVQDEDGNALIGSATAPIHLATDGSTMGEYMTEYPAETATENKALQFVLDSANYVTGTIEYYEIRAA